MESIGFANAGMVNTAVNPPLYTVHRMNVKIHQLSRVILTRNVVLKQDSERQRDEKFFCY
jgi:hypothetical protein